MTPRFSDDDIHPALQAVLGAMGAAAPAEGSDRILAIKNALAGLMQTHRSDHLKFLSDDVREKFIEALAEDWTSNDRWDFAYQAANNGIDGYWDAPDIDLVQACENIDISYVLNVEEDTLSAEGKEALQLKILTELCAPEAAALISETLEDAEYGLLQTLSVELEARGMADPYPALLQAVAVREAPGAAA